VTCAHGRKVGISTPFVKRAENAAPDLTVPADTWSTVS
jgi:hypothetical protein